MKLLENSFFYSRMNSTSCILANLLYFGPYPNQEMIENLEKKGISLVVDLTTSFDKLSPYKTSIEKIHYPITDGHIPLDFQSFSHIITRITLNLFQQRSVYIHCKGGHGRSGMVAACVLWAYYNISPKKAIDLVTIAHQNRQEMKNKWRKVKCPHIYKQRDLVYRFSQEIIQPF